jgi:hypothetical protein
MVDGVHQLRVPPGVRISALRDGGQQVRVASADGPTTPLTVKAGHVYNLEFAPSAAAVR